MSETIQAAVGKWRGIMGHFGIALPRGDAHGACPLCGGKDRFRFDDKEGRGTSICNQCGSRDGIQLVMAATGRAFADAAREIDGIVGRIAYQKPRPEMGDDARRNALRAAWQASNRVQPGDAVDVYLTARGVGLSEYPECLRTVPEVQPAGETITCAMMLARVDDADGVAATIHRTYISGPAKAPIEKPRMLMPGKFPEGGYVRLFEPGPVMGIAEGIETAIAAWKLWSIPVWSAISANNLIKWRPPEGVSEVVIFGDNDKSHTGHAAAFTLSHRLRVAGFKTDVQIPPDEGTDWADEEAA